MKVNISIDDKLMGEIDSFVARHYTTRSGFFAHASVNLLLQYEIRDSISSMSAAMKKIADTGDISEDTQRKLDDFQRLCELFTNNMP